MTDPRGRERKILMSYPHATLGWRLLVRGHMFCKKYIRIMYVTFCRITHVRSQRRRKIWQICCPPPRHVQLPAGDGPPSWLPVRRACLHIPAASKRGRVPAVALACQPVRPSAASWLGSMDIATALSEYGSREALLDVMEVDILHCRLLLFATTILYKSTRYVVGA